MLTITSKASTSVWASSPAFLAAAIAVSFASAYPCASVLVADGFRYNFLEDEDDRLRIDDEMILDNYTCRISFFNNLMISEMVDDEGNKLDPITGRILEANRH